MTFGSVRQRRRSGRARARVLTTCLLALQLLFLTKVPRSFAVRRAFLVDTDADADARARAQSKAADQAIVYDIVIDTVSAARRPRRASVG